MHNKKNMKHFSHFIFSTQHTHTHTQQQKKKKNINKFQIFGFRSFRRKKTFSLLYFFFKIFNNANYYFHKWHKNFVFFFFSYIFVEETFNFLFLHVHYKNVIKPGKFCSSSSKKYKKI